MFHKIAAVALALSIPLSASFASDSTDTGVADSDVVTGDDPSQVKRKRLGYGRLITNDFLGDGDDRWRTGSTASSRIYGKQWDGTLPTQVGSLIELRLGAEVIAPDNLVTPAAGDRRFAGAISVGAHTHFQRGKLDYALGADLVFVGPSTGLDDLQSSFHDIIGVSEPSTATLDGQIGNTIRPTLVAEVGKSIDLSPGTNMRPFVEARAGAETLLRAGFDLTFGQLGQEELLVRDSVAGQRYRTIYSEWSGFSFVMGADVAYVDSSVFLPSGTGPALENTRTRARAGVHWQNENGAAAFYGVTYLGEEFEGQDGGQVIGSLRVKFGF